MVKCIDDNVGKLVASLKRAGLLDRTIIVFTADHGDLRGEHHRQNKGVPYEASAKVPFLLTYPGKVKAGTIIREALGCVDFLPTILTLMGVSIDQAVEGRDASGLFLNGSAPTDWKNVAFLRSTGGSGQGWVAAVTGRYKLVLSADDPAWLFDLEQDPDELINFYGTPECRKTARRLATALLEYGSTFQDQRLELPAIRTALEATLHDELDSSAEDEDR